MQKLRFSAVLAGVASLLLVYAAVPGHAEAPTRNFNLNHVLLFARDSSCAAITAFTPPSEPLKESRNCNPVLAPDGHQVTLEEFLAPSGRAGVKCIADGTQSVLHFNGLIPNGTYTIWQIVFKSPGFDGTFANRIGVGSLGPNDGSGNTFVADGDGEGEISAVSPAGNLSILGTIPACWLPPGVFEMHLVGAYHIDGQSHGTRPGPAGTFIEQFGFIF